MDVKLHLVKGNPKGKTLDIPEGTFVVGRAEDSDLIIASTRVSRKHCELANKGDTLTIRDAGSANGTIVNGARITEQALKPGDTVEVGPLTFTIEIEGVNEASHPQPGAAKAAPDATSKPTPERASPQPKPKRKPPAQGGKGSDIFSALDQMARKKQPKDEDVLEISDEDILSDES